VEEVTAEAMQADKIVKLFQTMAIVTLNMGNLNLKVSNFKNVLTIEEKKKATLQEELEKEMNFQTLEEK
jgi:hypothetical protein